jgi:quercetin dioxygenase-like cupin family protein
MKLFAITTTSKLVNRLILASLVGSTAACSGMSTSMNSITENKTIPQQQLEFETIAPFVKMATVSGDRASGSHATLGVFKAGAASPLHVHSKAYQAVVISGTMTNPFAGEVNPTQLEAGSYWQVPANIEHVTACVSADPGMFYFYSDGAFDFSPR